MDGSRSHHLGVEREPSAEPASDVAEHFGRRFGGRLALNAEVVGRGSVRVGDPVVFVAQSGARRISGAGPGVANRCDQVRQRAS